MRKWEYDIKVFSVDELQGELMRCGACGWEAFSITFNPLISDAWVYFKREIQQEDKW